MPMPADLRTRIMNTVLGAPDVIEATEDALNQLHDDLHLLSDASAADLNQIVRGFAEGVRGQANFFNPFAAQASIRADNQRNGVLEPEQERQIIDRGEDVKVEDRDVLPCYLQDVAKPLLARLKAESDANDSFDQNLLDIIGQVAKTMQHCTSHYDLSYHVIWHALMVMGMTTINAADNGCDQDWALFAGLLGLTHDAIFTRRRGPDEEDSAKLFLDIAKPFIDSLDAPEDADKPKAKLFEAMVRVILRFGTLPIVHAPRKENGPDFSQIKMQSAAEVFMQHCTEHLTEENPLQQVLACTQAIASADIHGSLNPWGFELSYPFGDAFRLREGLNGVDDVGSLRYFINDYLNADGNPFRCSAREAEIIILNKLAQGGRFFTENQAFGKPTVKKTQQENDDVAEDVVAEGMRLAREKRSALQNKMAMFLRNDLQEDIEFTEDDLMVFAGGRFTFVFDQVQYTVTEPGLIAGEIGFANMQLRGTMPANPMKLASGAFDNFFPESWRWHKELYEQMRGFIDDPANSLARRSRVLRDILVVARNQPGKQFDLGRYKEFLQQVALRYTPKEALGCFDVLSECCSSMWSIAASFFQQHCGNATVVVPDAAEEPLLHRRPKFDQ